MYRKKLRKKDCTFQLHTVHRKKFRKKNCMSQWHILHRKTCLNFYIRPLGNLLKGMGIIANILNFKKSHYFIKHCFFGGDWYCEWARSYHLWSATHFHRHLLIIEEYMPSCCSFSHLDLVGRLKRFDMPSHFVSTYGIKWNGRIWPKVKGVCITASGSISQAAYEVMMAVNRAEKNAFYNPSPKYWETCSHKNVKCSDNLPQLVRAALDSFPAPHTVQEEAPEDELYFPGAHLAQEDMLELLYSPAGHFTEGYGNKSMQCEFEVISELILRISSFFKMK